MKTLSLSGVLGGTMLFVTTGSFAAQPVMRDVATHDQLSEKLRVATNQGPVTTHRPAEGPDPAKLANQASSLTAQSDFLSFGGRGTLVPKRAILHVPPSMADRIRFAPGSKAQTWADFFAMNRAWLTTVEVTRKQASGKEPLAEELVERIKKSSSVVVATYKAGPISVLPLKVPAAPVPATTTSTTTTKP